MTTRGRNLLFLATIVLLAAVGLYFGTPRPGAGTDALLGAVPRDAWLVATLDVDALRTSPLAAPIGGGNAAGDLLGIGKLQDLCGFDPLARVHRLAVAAPEGGEKGDFGVAAAGEIKRDELLACARKAIEARGGSARPGTRGAFGLMEDANDAGGARIAVRDGGPLLVGRGPWLDAMMDASEGKAPRLSENPAHAGVRDLLATRAKGAKHPPTLVVTAVLPTSLRERLKREMGEGENGGPNAAMLGVLDVDTAGLSVTSGATGEDTEADLELHCVTAAGCVEVRRFMEKQRLVLSQSFAVRLLGLGPLLDSLAFEAADTGLSARAHAPTDTLAQALDRALKYRAQSPKPPPRPAPAASAALPPAAPDADAGPR